MDTSQRSWSGDLVDAYAHIGNPKYGTLADVDHFINRLSIQQAVLALGPGIPDLASLILARQRYGDRIRYMGIPFGETAAQRFELGLLQIKMGISGMRFMPNELAPNRGLIDKLGEAALCLYAINPLDSPNTMRFLIDWLEQFPKGNVASPHFIRPTTVEAQVTDIGLAKTLLQHPRYHAIFSRQGGTGTTEPYPHRDLLPWVEQMAALVTWKRILWGSEFPIIYQRNEQPEQVRDWLLDLGVSFTTQDQFGFFANNTRQLFFANPPPVMEPITIPGWVQSQIDQTDTVYLFPANRVFIPMQTHRLLLSDYLERCQAIPDLRFADYIAQVLSKHAETLSGE
ncbi:MAG: amidohydrolase family protein [Chloroflexota bacterium]